MPHRRRRPEEATRLPYLVDAALRSTRSVHNVQVEPVVVEERQESEQRSRQELNIKQLESVHERKNRLKRGKKYVPRLLPGAKSNATDETGGYVPPLPALDERVLILYHSSLKRAWKQRSKELTTVSSSRYGHEAIYAATQIQKIFRGVAARIEWKAFYCIRNQDAATRIQFAFRRVVVCRKVLARLARKRNDRATQIQAWYRGHRCRDLLWCQHIRTMNQRITNFQRYIRGRRLWRIVMAILYKRRSDVATEIQRCYRGWKGRQRAVAVLFERNRHVRELLYQNEIHARCTRCKKCNLESCTEDSLFECFMVRYVGLHDFKGARTLGEDGLRIFPSSSKFTFFFSVLLQAMCEDIETSMSFLKRAKELGISHESLLQYETHFFQPAHLLRPTDAQAFLDLAILCQSHDQLPRAEAYYAKALAQSPQEYAIPGYLHRVHMVDRLLLNYHRFCSVFNFRQVNVLLKEVSTSKKGKKVRVMVSKLNHYTIITPADDTRTCRINSLYLTDDEVLSVSKLSEGEEEGSKLDYNMMNKSYKSIATWGSSNMNSSMRQKTFRSTQKDIPDKSSRLLLQKIVLPQLYQKEVTGLDVKPSDLAQFSETRSRVRLTKPTAELLLNALVFVDPVATDKLSKGNGNQQTDSIQFVLHKVMLIPSILKIRQEHRSAILHSWAAIDTQRVYRGFRLRAEVRRERLLNDIRQRQADEMYRRLHENYLLRELRRSSAVAIQRMYKGYAFRKLLRRWVIQAVHIQRIFRGYRGRLRAAAFREGSCTFYMAQRVFQRGVDISGRRVMLIIDKCGMSFRLDGYDLESCNSYHGFFSHSSTVALLCFLNWTYGESLCGREFMRRGDKITIHKVLSVNHVTGECLVECVGATSAGFTFSLADCVQAINLRNFSAGDKDSPSLLLPMTVDDSTRLVEALVERVILVPALRMSTTELKAKAPSDFTIAIRPPPKMHFTYRHISGLSRKPYPNSYNTSPLQYKYPVMPGIRGVSVGAKHFRKKCARHAVHFTRCRCVLPIVSTSAHVEAIAHALASPSHASP